MMQKNTEFYPFTLLDEQKVARFHWKIIFITGMGFFTDAYDIFIIGVVTSILIPLWHLTDFQVSLLHGASLFSAVIGAIFFGYFADRMGRKKLYGVEMAILFVGAILSAISVSFIWLMLSRILLGIGIGGDYPSSAIVTSEYANRKNRGFLVLFVFTMQALGLIVGPLITAFFLSFHLPEEYVWRILLALGAIPAACVFFHRRKIAETPRYIHIQHFIAMDCTIRNLSGHVSNKSYRFFQQHQIFHKPWLKTLIATSASWFLFDIAFYGNGVSSILIINHIFPNASLIQYTFLATLIFLIFAFPGYILAATFVDMIGRKKLQSFGFIIMTICYASMALIHDIGQHLFLFIGLFGLSFFFINFGPNATTFLIPSEIFPTKIRAQAHGISAAIGKIGAVAGVCLLPTLLSSYQFSFTMEFVAFISLLGAAITQLLPEMSQKSLEMTEVLQIKSINAADHPSD